MNDIKLKKITVSIGDFYVSSTPVFIETLLGSCVSVTMFDPVKKIGGLNHIVLPGTFLESDYEKMFDEKDSRYGIFSLENLLYKMESFGSERKNIEAKIFGASFLGRSKQSAFSIQESNIEFVKAFISMAKLKVIEEVIFQEEALKISLNTFNGAVKVTKVKNGF